MNCKLTPVNQKENLQISYGHAKSPVGGCFIAWSELGICFLAFGDTNVSTQALSDIQAHWPNAELKENNAQADSLIAKIFSSTNHDLIVSGTDFQIKVWNELLNIKAGETISYEMFAAKIGGKNYTRASASVIARNNISYLIPCHRIIRKSGDISKYRWGAEYKKKLLEYEKNC